VEQKLLTFPNHQINSLFLLDDFRVRVQTMASSITTAKPVVLKLLPSLFNDTRRDDSYWMIFDRVQTCSEKCDDDKARSQATFVLWI
jgi:hypothetical protein